MLTDPAREAIAPYVSSTSADVFAIFGLAPEDVAVLLAHAAKSPLELRASFAKLIADTRLATAAFRETARTEHAPLHVGIERTSFLVAGLLLDARGVACTERHTRHLPIDDDSLTPLPEL